MAFLNLLGQHAKVYNQSMTDRAQAVLQEAMTLPADERANVAAELLASLDDFKTEDPAAVQAAWAKEIERRGRRVLAGESSGEPWEDVRDRVAKRLTRP
jgi:putative addiction module component (TIGR02574 family)